jgi:hypothetical protein
MGLNLGKKSILSDLGDVNCTSGGDPIALIEEALIHHQGIICGVAFDRSSRST